MIRFPQFNNLENMKFGKIIEYFECSSNFLKNNRKKISNQNNRSTHLSLFQYS